MQAREKLSLIHFQGPSTGNQFALRETPKGLRVECSPTEGETLTADDLTDARAMTASIHSFRTLDEAARYLNANFGTDI